MLKPIHKMIFKAFLLVGHQKRSLSFHLFRLLVACDNSNHNFKFQSPVSKTTKPFIAFSCANFYYQHAYCSILL